MPHRGVDPIVVASQIVLALQTIVSRGINPSQGGVISVTEVITDGTVNVVPTTVTLRGDTRSFTADVQSLIESGIERIAKGLCAANGIECDVRYERVFDATFNSLEETAVAAGDTSEWVAPIVRCVSTRGEGIDELVEGLKAHRRWLNGTTAGQQRKLTRLRESMRTQLRNALIDCAVAEMGEQLEQIVLKISRREVDPYTAAEQLVERFQHLGP